MTGDVLSMSRQARGGGDGPVTDFWLATVDVRLSRIERMMERMERQVWALAAVAGGLLLVDLMRMILQLRGGL
ncbi:hypothetical protein [Pelagovum sp. HNIBRBA483]|uniref:hypothetical protein n=1 Tax=Pelagovum sp. HNIBRBA483 TaxID=3233341 RepID=UPI0034A3AEEB